MGLKDRYAGDGSATMCARLVAGKGFGMTGIRDRTRSWLHALTTSTATPSGRCALSSFGARHHGLRTWPNDRQWMVIDAGERFTHRQLPRMSLIDASVDKDGAGPGGEGFGAIRGWRNNAVGATVWNDALDAVLVDPAADRLAQ